MTARQFTGATLSVATTGNDRGRRFGRLARAVLTVSAATVLGACGGNTTASSGAVGGGRSTAATEPVPQVSAQVVSLTPIADRQIGNSVVREVTYRVTLTVGPVSASGLALTIAKAVPGTSIIDGSVVVGDVAAGATLTPEDTVTLRHVTVLPFDPGDPGALTWRVSGTPVVRVVTFDPALCQPQAGAPSMQTVGIRGTQMMVSSGDVRASAAGCRVLARGGSAADAAVAVQAVLGVVEPFSSGLAGGAVVTHYDARTRKVRSYDGLARAPINIGAPTTTTVYQMAVESDLLCRPGQSIGSSLSTQQGNTNISGRATGVPGAVRVLDQLHGQHGRLPWSALWDEAIALATDGFPMTAYMYSTLYNVGTVFDEETGEPLDAGGVRAWWNAARTRWGAVRCRYADIQARYCDPSDPASELPLPLGTMITNLPLAQTMAQVRDGGAAVFYDPDGPIVAAILQRFLADKIGPDGSNNCFSLLPTYLPDGTTSAPIIPARIPSLMAAQDFADYTALERDPLVGERFGLTVHTMPAPLFGGVVTLYSLGLVERLAIDDQAWASEGFYYRAVEASRLANADRRNIVGDPAYSNVDERVAALLSDAYLDARAALVDGTALVLVPAGGEADGIPPFQAGPPPKLAAAGHSAAPGEDRDTTSSLAIVDGYGNALAMTTTINTRWGAHIEAAGMMLNNAMSNFSTGTVGFDVNRYEPLKRPRSAIAPSIATDAEGRVRLVWGAAGGGQIPDYIVKTFLGHLVFGLELQAVINADNWSGQGQASSIAEFESGRPIAALIDGMRAEYGYTSSTLREADLISGLAGIAVEYDVFGFPIYYGAADPRRVGGANGY